MAAEKTIDGLSVLDSSCIHPLAVFPTHKRCCGSSIAVLAGTATATCEPAHDLNGVLIVNAPNAHSIRIDSERF